MPTVTINNKTTNKFSLAVTETELREAKTALQENGFNVVIVDGLEEAKKTVERLIPEQSEVFTATSVTLKESGLEQSLNNPDLYVSVRDKYMAHYGNPEKAVEMRRIGSASDYAVGSVHALTQEGHVVIASASGSQLPNYVYGASNVIWVVGAQKIVSDLDEAFDRIENHTLPLEDKRALAAYGVNSSINKVLIYRKEQNKRVTIVLVKEPVGF